MRPIKRFLVFASEVGVFVCGLILSLAIGVYFESEWAFWFGSILTVVEFFRFRRRTRSWKIEYDAVGFELRQAGRRLHPRRALYRRIIGRTLLWVPSAITAFVLFFFPVATHLVHPSSRYFEHYRVPIPWAMSVFPRYGWVDAFIAGERDRRFGVTPFWVREPPSSLMTFVSNYPNAADAEYVRRILRMRVARAPQVLLKDFRLGGVALICSQYEVPHDQVWRIWPDGAGPYWIVVCETPGGASQQDLFATFYGRERDMSAFYKIIEGVTPVK